MFYNWQWSNWPNFSYSTTDFEGDLLAFTDKSGQIDGLLRGLSKEDQSELTIQILALEALKSAEIGGEYLNYQDLLSAIRNQLGLNAPLEPVRDRASEGAAELAATLRNTWDEPLDEATLFTWHHMLMKGTSRMESGMWRTGSDPKQIISFPQGKRHVHFEAPPPESVPAEMKRFIDWFNLSRNSVLNAPVRAAIAHLHFESILPFEDGNGRIGRALSDKAFSQGLGRPAVISLSAIIESDKKRYFEALEAAQDTYEITHWIYYILSLAREAQELTESRIEFALKKSRFLHRHESQCDQRQWLVVSRMLREAPDGSESYTNARNYIEQTGVSKATATRDLRDLVSKGALNPIGGGRGARYELNFP